jgi:arylsulfatase
VVSNQLASTIDLFPTIAAITKASLPNKKIDGVSILPILQGDKNATPRKTFLYYYRKNSLEAVRIDNWKLVFAHPSRSYLNQLPGMNGYPGKSPEDVNMAMALYDLRRDPAENYDVKETHPDMVKKLQALAEEARADLGDDLQKRTGANNRAVGKIDN